MTSKLSSNASVASVLTFRWLDEGEIRESNDQRLQHQKLRLRGKDGAYLEIHRDDAVFIATSSGDTSMAKLQGLWQDQGGQPTCSYRWLLSAADLEDNRQDLHENELVLGNQLEVNDISCIQERLDGFQLVEKDETWPTKAKYACRYGVVLQDDKIELLPYRDSTDMVQEAINNGRGNESSMSDDDQSTASSSSSSSSPASSERAPIVEGEGSNLRGDIQVGPSHQVTVPPFKPGVKVASRGAKRVWAPGKISNKDLHAFLEKLAGVQTPYLKKEGLTHDDPYTPVSSKQADRLISKQPHLKLTGSSLSSASMVSETRCGLLKECDVDAVLELIHDSDYNLEKSFEEARKDPGRYCVRWTHVEKGIFEENNRRSNGSLRAIKKAIAPTKNMNDVVDYHFRFKIPDQHRRYQNKKMEQAVRILECIETKRAHEPIAMARPTPKRPKTAAWTETSVNDTIGALDDRRVKAKELLLDVEKQIGKKALGDVAVVVRHLLQSYDAETKDILFQVLHGQDDLQKRFLEFLPKHF